MRLPGVLPEGDRRLRGAVSRTRLSRDLREPLGAIAGKAYDTRDFARHLDELAGPGGRRIRAVARALGVDGNLSANPRALAGRARHLQAPVERRDPVGEAP